MENEMRFIQVSLLQSTITFPQYGKKGRYKSFYFSQWNTTNCHTRAMKKLFFSTGEVEAKITTGNRERSKGDNVYGENY